MRAVLLLLGCWLRPGKGGGSLLVRGLAAPASEEKAAKEGARALVLDPCRGEKVRQLLLTGGRGCGCSKGWRENRLLG